MSRTARYAGTDYAIDFLVQTGSAISDPAFTLELDVQFGTENMRRFAEQAVHCFCAATSLFTRTNPLLPKARRALASLKKTCRMEVSTALNGVSDL